MLRSHWITVAGAIGVGGLALTGASLVMHADVGTTLTIRLDGGNAYVFRDGNKRVDIGAVKRPDGDTSSDFNEHHMRLSPESGEVVSTAPDSITAQRDGIHRPFWPVDGYEIRVCPGGTCPTTSTLTTSPRKTPSVACNPSQDRSDPNGFVDNLYYVPNLLELHPGSTLRDGWEQMLESRLVLRTGRLAVADAIGCFTFQGSGPGNQRKQSIVNGTAGIQYQLTTTEPFIDFQFYTHNPATNSDSLAGRVRLQPTLGQHEVHVAVTTGERGAPVSPGQPVPHFKPFYRLIDTPSGMVVSSDTQPQLDLIYTPPGAPADVPRNTSPGGECPSVRIGGSTP